MQDFASPKNRKVKTLDLLASVVFSVIFLVFITWYDITLHDSFVLPSYECHPNTPAADTEFCQKIMEKNSIKVPFTQFAYEYTERDTYWIWMQAIIFAFGLVFAVARAMMGSLEAGFLWALTITLPIFAGFEDFLYFAARDIPVPEELPWLNGNVIIGITNNIVSPEGSPVTEFALYVAMGVAVAILALAWFLALKPEDLFDKRLRL